MEGWKIKREIRGIVKILAFLFGLGIIIAPTSAELKMFGLLYIILSIN